MLIAKNLLTREASYKFSVHTGKASGASVGRSDSPAFRRIWRDL